MKQSIDQLKTKMCCGYFYDVLTYSRSIGNSLLLIESIAIISILFQNFNPEYNTLSCGCPWAALFTILLANVIIVSNWQDWATINYLKNYIDRIPKFSNDQIRKQILYQTNIRNKNLDQITNLIKKKNDRIQEYQNNINKQYNSNYYCLPLCCLASSTGTVYLLNTSLRIWTFTLWLMFGTESSCYSENIFNLLVSTSFVFLLALLCVVVYGIVQFFRWCVPSCSQCQRELKEIHTKLEQERQQRQMEYEKKVNLDRVQELELQMKETKNQLEETKSQLDETKRELCSSVIPVASEVIATEITIIKKEEVED